jgi:MOSC domain-containing protein YiiM
VTARVESIFTAPAEALSTVRHKRATVRPGVGIVGDRYAAGTGYWSTDHKVSRDLTLIEGEVIDALAEELGTPIEPGMLRRNVVTRGVRLNDLVGVRFRIGELLVEGTSLCEPCVHLQRIVGKPILRPLVHRGGLRANVLNAAEIGEGSPIDLNVPRVGVGVVVKRAGRYLLGLRRASRGDGTWSTPGGEVLPAEGVLDCALRELREETSLEGRTPRVVAQASNRLDDAEHWCSVFIAVDVPQAEEPRISEPDRCVEWGWFDPLHLPRPLFAPVADLLRTP